MSRVDVSLEMSNGAEALVADITLLGLLVVAQVVASSGQTLCE